MRDVNALSRREREIIGILHRMGSASAAEVRGEMERSPSDSAVRTHLRILEEKGWLHHRAEGTRYIYFPVQSAETTKRKALTNVVRTFFQGSLSDVVAALLDKESGRLDEAELRRIETIISEARRKNTKS